MANMQRLLWLHETPQSVAGSQGRGWFNSLGRQAWTMPQLGNGSREAVAEGGCSAVPP